MDKEFEWRLRILNKINTISYNRLADQEIANFRNEVLTIIGLEHPNIVRVYEFGIDNHIPYIVMAYIPNGSLRTFYRSGTSLPPNTVLDGQVVYGT